VASSRRSKDDLRVLRYKRLTNSYGDVVHFVLVERAGVQHAFRINLGGTASAGYTHLGTGAGATRFFDNGVGNTLDNITGYDPDFTVETERLDAVGEKAVRLLTHPFLGVDWAKHQPEAADPEAVDLADFHKLLEKQVREWKGSRSSFAAANHRYWPTFKAMFDKAVKSAYGSKVKLYRGVYGKYAGDILRGGPIKINRLTAWTNEKAEALGFAHHGGGGGGGGKGRDYWLVVEVPYPVTNIVAAPVTIPEYTPDPTIYHAFRHESEFVVEDRRGSLPASAYRIVAKSRKKLTTAERVAMRYADKLV